MNYSQSTQVGSFQPSQYQSSVPKGKGRMAGQALMNEFSPQLLQYSPRNKIDYRTQGAQMGMITPEDQIATDYRTIANKAENERRKDMTSVPLREKNTLKW